jgi:hypothetical protein
MKIWLLRVLIVSAIGACVYYNRRPPLGDQPLPAADDTVERVGAAAGP